MTSPGTSTKPLDQVEPKAVTPADLVKLTPNLDTPFSNVYHDPAVSIGLGASSAHETVVDVKTDEIVCPKQVTADPQPTKDPDSSCSDSVVSDDLTDSDDDDESLDLTTVGDRCYNVNCRKTNVPGGLKKCTKCRVAMYCSRECQAKHWPVHKSGCQLLVSNKVADLWK